LTERIDIWTSLIFGLESSADSRTNESMFDVKRTLFLRNRNIRQESINSCAIDSLVEFCRFAILPFLENKDLFCGPLITSLLRLVSKIDAAEIELNNRSYRTEGELIKALYERGKDLTVEIDDD